MVQDEGEGDESEKDDDDVKVMVVDGVMLEKRHLGVSIPGWDWTSPVLVENFVAGTWDRL